jgi:molybdopterin synthase catalytic subunit
MKVRLRLFAAVREIVGSGEVALEVPEHFTAGQLVRRVGEMYPRLQGLAPSLLLAVNREYCAPEQPLRDGDEVALIPPVSGGGGAEAGPADPNPDLYRMTDVPLSLDALARRVGVRSSGAVAGFLGIVREQSRGRQVNFLEYEAYPEMAEAKMRQIGEEIRAKWPVDALAIVHRAGRLTVGEASVAIAVASPHRHAALQACAYAIERLKEIVPIWKKEVWADGSEWIGSTMDEYKERNTRAGRP